MSEKILIRPDAELLEQFKRYKSHLQDELGVRVSDNQAGIMLLHRALIDVEISAGQAPRRKYQQPRKTKTGTTKIDPNGPILAQVRNL
jgi:hypothetical protein